MGEGSEGEGVEEGGEASEVEAREVVDHEFCEGGGEGEGFVVL